MSRTRRTALTALVLLVLSSAVFFARRETGGVDVGPPGTSVWEVTLSVRGEFPAKKNPKKEERLVVYSPPDFRRQHVSDSSWKSDELTSPTGRAGAKTPREQIVWKARPDAAPEKGYRLAYTFRVVLGANHPSNAMKVRTKTLDGEPKGTADKLDKSLRATPRIQSTRAEVANLAADVVADGSALDQFRTFHEHVNGLPYQTGAGQTALDCLRNWGGDDTGKSRLLVALCRSRKIPARVVVGVVLNPNATPVLHRWAEAWVKTPERPDGQWVPACPTYGQFGLQKWPTNYVVMRLGDGPVVSGSGSPRLTLFARPLPDEPGGRSRVQSFWRSVSLSNLPPAEQHLARFLVLLPLATVIVSVFRVLIGTRTFGVFTPALLGLIFRDLTNLPWGMGIFTATVIVGWLLRKVLDRYHLLLIPRTAVMLTLIVVFLLVVLGVGARAGVQITGYLALFPIIILTHMVERFWTLETEDGVASSFRTLLGTLLVSVVVAVALSPDAVGRWVFRYPETLGAVVAVLLLLGRYTGYRLTELYRFQDVIEFPTKAEGGMTNDEPGMKTEGEKTDEPGASATGEKAPAPTT